MLLTRLFLFFLQMETNLYGAKVLFIFVTDHYTLRHSITHSKCIFYLFTAFFYREIAFFHFSELR